MFPVRGHKTVPQKQKQEVKYLENFPTLNFLLSPRSLESVVILANRGGCGTWFSSINLLAQINLLIYMPFRTHKSHWPGNLSRVLATSGKGGVFVVLGTRNVSTWPLPLMWLLVPLHELLMASSAGILFSPGHSDWCVLMVTMWAQRLGFKVLTFTESVCPRLCSQNVGEHVGLIAAKRGCKINLLFKGLVEKWQMSNTPFLQAPN